jgi:DNA ligase-associated metallophosphoesterase
MAVPAKAGIQTLLSLKAILERYKPEQVYFLGDLFHSVYNKDWERFIQFRRGYVKITFHLIEGNHDILNDEEWQAAELKVHREKLELGPFTLVHDPDLEVERGFKIAGHLHPCVLIKGPGKQSLRIPCFWRSEHQMVLPSFGSFTGMHKIKAKKGDDIYLVTEEHIVHKKIES